MRYPAHTVNRSIASTLQDARAQKSSQALETAMLELLERKPFDQITVREITLAAGVHYATFFRHHPTKEALLDHIAADQIERLVALTVPIMHARDLQAAFLMLSLYVEQHRRLWTALLTGGAAGTMRAALLRISREVAAERAPSHSPIPVGLAVNCTVSLIVETLSWWLEQPAGAISPEEAAFLLDRLVGTPFAVSSAGGCHRPEGTFCEVTEVETKEI